MERRNFYDRLGPAILISMVLSVPFLCRGVSGILGSASNDPRQWLPVGLRETQEYDWFLEHFGRDEIAVVSWPGCTLDDPRVSQLAEALLRDSNPRYFERVLTGPEVLEELTTGPAGLSRSEAVKRLQGNLVGDDLRTTGLILVVSPEGERNRKAAVQQVSDAAAQIGGLFPSELRLGGPTVDAAALDRESQRMLYRLAALCAGIVFLAAWQQMKSLYVALVILLCATYNTALTLAVAYWTGGRMNLTMTNIVPLVFVLSVSMSIHLINYYRDALREGVRGARERAAALGWLPCLLAAGTTAVGFLSLTFSSVEPIRDFGVYSAVGMLISVVVLLLFLPAALVPRVVQAQFAEVEAVPRTQGAGSFSTIVPAVWAGRVRRIPAAMMRGHLWIALAFVALMVASAPGLARLKATVKLQHRFPEQSQIVRDTKWLEENIAQLVPLEIVVRFDDAAERRFSDKMRIVEDIQQELEKLAHVDATTSAVTLAPPLPERRNFGEAIRARVLDRRLSQRKEHFVDAHYLAEDGKAELWRITARLPALSDVDYGHYIDKVQSRLDPVIASKWGNGVTAVYTGAVPLIYKAQRLLLKDLGESFFGAFAVIALVMVVALASPKAGLVAMIPNIFPAVSVFGIMGWSGFLVEIGTVSTASIALGIAVDNTFHFLTWYRRGVQSGCDRREAIRYAYRHCARAMIQTTLLCVLGLLAFTFSSFLPTVRFAWLMVVLLGAALAGDLILLPALLLGRLGQCFSPRGPRCTGRQVGLPASEKHGDFSRRPPRASYAD